MHACMQVCYVLAINAHRMLSSKRAMLSTTMHNHACTCNAQHKRAMLSTTMHACS